MAVGVSPKWGGTQLAPPGTRSSCGSGPGQDAARTASWFLFQPRPFHVSGALARILLHAAGLSTPSPARGSGCDHPDAPRPSPARGGRGSPTQAQIQPPRERRAGHSQGRHGHRGASPGLPRGAEPWAGSLGAGGLGSAAPTVLPTPWRHPRPRREREQGHRSETPGPSTPPGAPFYPSGPPREVSSGA